MIGVFGQELQFRVEGEIVLVANRAIRMLLRLPDGSQPMATEGDVSVGFQSIRRDGAIACLVSLYEAGEQDLDSICL